MDSNNNAATNQSQTGSLPHSQVMQLLGSNDWKLSSALFRSQSQLSLKSDLSSSISISDRANCVIGRQLIDPAAAAASPSKSSSSSTSSAVDYGYFGVARHLLKLGTYAEFVSGYVAACASITILFPFNKLIFRQILEGISFGEALAQLRVEGAASIYRGLLPPLLQKSISYSIMFGTQSEYQHMLERFCAASGCVERLEQRYLHVLLTSVSASLAGLTEATLTPFERVQAVLQMQQYHQSYRHTWHVFAEMTRVHGYRELYRGGTAICLRNTLSNTLFFTTRVPLKALFPAERTRLQNSAYDFITGGLIGASISTLFYPLNVLKAHMQARVGGKYATMYQTFLAIYHTRDKRLALFYKGVSSNFLRALFYWGITNSAYEFTLSTLRSEQSAS